MDKPPRAVDPKIGGFSVLKGIPPVAQDVFQRWRLGRKNSGVHPSPHFIERLCETSNAQSLKIGTERRPRCHFWPVSLSGTTARTRT